MTTATAPARSAISSKPYTDLGAKLRELATLRSIERTMAYDQETTMPEAGATFRADQLSLLAGMCHRKATDPALGDLITACESDSAVNADPIASANIREARRDFNRLTKLPNELIEELSKSSSLGMEAWKAARVKSDFKAFQPHLEKIVGLVRQKAQCYGIPPWGAELYDALMDEYEPEMTAKRTAAIFGPLREFTVGILDRVRASSKKINRDAIHTESPIANQMAFSRRVVEKLGFDLHAGRMDQSTHPFCEGLAPGDTRFTNRFSATGWADQLFTAAHENGHAIYEQGLPKAAYMGWPCAEAVSLGIHESQSRMLENLICRSRAFWDWGLKIAREELPMLPASLTADAVYQCVNEVKPWFIRVESDEVTYNLHIMLRFDLERALISGDLAVKDLPAEWNRRMKADLGLDIKEDRLGCLQDIHWSMASIGYFATYTLGNLYSAQLWEAMAKDVHDREAKIARGEFTEIIAWLRDKIHRHGRTYSPGQLCERATGKPLDSTALMRHLEAKVTSIYG